jgi:hypothetical protein
VWHAVLSVAECTKRTVSAHILPKCCATENRRLIVTPRALIGSSRANPGTADGGITMARLLLGENYSFFLLNASLLSNFKYAVYCQSFQHPSYQPKS